MNMSVQEDRFQDKGGGGEGLVASVGGAETLEANLRIAK